MVGKSPCMYRARSRQGASMTMRNVTAMPATLAGRCADGRELGQGSRIHAVTGLFREDYRELHGIALCGAKPGKRSVGWTALQNTAHITCPRCLKKAQA